MKTSFRIPLLSAALITSAAAYENAVMLKAADLLPAEQLQGPCHRVREQVATDGFMAHFEIDTDFGTFEAVGVPQVRRRIVEAEAIRKLVETSKSDLFAEGMKRSIEQPIDAVKNIVTDPVESVKQAPKTVGHFFSKVGASIGRGVDKVKKGNEEGTSHLRGRSIGNAAKNAAGFDKAKLDTARQLGVDPYSDNARLQEEMDKVTWAFFAGGLPLRIGAAVASAGVDPHRHQHGRHSGGNLRAHPVRARPARQPLASGDGTEGKGHQGFPAPAEPEHHAPPPHREVARSLRQRPPAAAASFC